jgi:hypothetical protein
MTKLISTVAAVVFGVATLAGAAPGQGAMGKAGKEARDKAVKAEKAEKPARSYPNVYAKDQRQAGKRDLKADEKELKRLRKDLKQAQKAGDWRRAQRDRAAISRLEYEIRAERQYIKNQGRYVRDTNRRDTRSWWGRHTGRNGS